MDLLTKLAGRVQCGTPGQLLMGRRGVAQRLKVVATTPSPLSSSQSQPTNTHPPPIDVDTSLAIVSGQEPPSKKKRRADSFSVFKERRRLQTNFLHHLLKSIQEDFSVFIEQILQTNHLAVTEFTAFYQEWEKYELSLVYALGFALLSTKNIINRIHNHLQDRFITTTSMGEKNVIIATIYCLYYAQPLPERETTNNKIVRYPIPVDSLFLQCLVQWFREKVESPSHYASILAHRLVEEDAFQLFLTLSHGDRLIASIRGTLPEDSDTLICSEETNDKLCQAEKFLTNNSLGTINRLRIINQSYDEKFGKSNLRNRRYSHIGFAEGLNKLITTRTTSNPQPRLYAPVASSRLVNSSQAFTKNRMTATVTGMKKIPIAATTTSTTATMPMGRLKLRRNTLPIRPSTAPPSGIDRRSSITSLQVYPHYNQISGPSLSRNQILDYLSIDMTNNPTITDDDMPDLSGLFAERLYPHFPKV